MGKTIDNLKQVQQQREGQGLLPEEELQELSPKGTIPKTVLTILLIVVILISLAFNAKLFSVLVSNSKQSNNTLTKINELTQTLSELSASLNQNVSKLNSKLDEFGNKLDAQDTAVSNLTKAKDTIYKRVSDLESKTETVNKVVKVEESN